MPLPPPPGLSHAAVKRVQGDAPLEPNKLEQVGIFCYKEVVELSQKDVPDMGFLGFFPVPFQVEPVHRPVVS